MKATVSAGEKAMISYLLGIYRWWNFTRPKPQLGVVVSVVLMLVSVHTANAAPNRP